MKETNLDVLVVGAGPTGLTLANELARYGLRFAIIDKNAEASSKSKALAVHSRTLEVFENMGVLGSFLKDSLKLSGINFLSGGKQIARMTFDELDSPYPFTISLPQSRTERLLEAHLKGLGSQVERSVELVRIIDNGSTVSSVIRRGEEEETLTSRWVVGCDGSHSTIRHALNLEFAGSKYPNLFNLGDLRIEGDIAPDELFVYTSDDGLLALFPYGGGRYRLVVDMGESPESSSQLPDPTLAMLQAVTDERSPVKLTLSDMEWSAALTLHCRHVSSYRVGNIFLAGDAAHIHSPAGGQGMNTGIQDSYNLAWKMALVASGAASDKLLDSYEAERLAIAIGVLRMTDFMTRVNTLKNPVARQVRNLLAPILAAQEVVQKRLKNDISELSLHYRHSPIVQENRSSLVKSVIGKDSPDLFDCFEFNSGPEAGDRAPDAFVSLNADNQKRLFELMHGTKHTLLLFSGRETEAQELRLFESAAQAINETYAELVKLIIVVGSPEGEAKCAHIIGSNPDLEAHVLPDWEMSCHHKYGAGSNCTYLIRPDGYVAFRSQPIDIERLLSYLTTVLDGVRLKSARH